jgi:hypothetical protein
MFHVQLTLKVPNAYITRPVWCGVSKGVAHLQGVEASGMLDPGETLGSPWTPLAIQACISLWDEYVNFEPKLVKI